MRNKKGGGSVHRKALILSSRQSLRSRLIAIGLLNAILIFLSLITLWFAIGQQSNDALLVNLAGRQRMLTQRIAKNCLILENDDLDTYHASASEALYEALDLYEGTLQMFYRGGSTLLNDEKEESAPVEGHDRALENLLVEWRVFRSDVETFADTPSAVSMTSLLMQSEKMLNDSDDIVSELQLDAESHLQSVQLIALSIGFLEIILFIFFLFNMENAVLKPFRRFEKTLDQIGIGEIDDLTQHERYIEWERIQKHVLNMNERLYQTKMALNTMNEELESMVDQRTEALNEKIKELQRTYDKLIESEKQASLGGLVAGVAHEVNTPLGVCITAASQLSESDRQLIRKIESGQLTKSELRDYLETSKEISEIILNNINRAADIIHNFKKIAVDQSDVRYDHFYIDDYIGDVLFSLKHILKHKTCDIKNEVPHIRIYSDPGAFGQIYTNLIMNTVQHAYGPDEPIRILLTGYPVKSDETIVLIYEDYGIGIPPESLGRIFEPFYTTNRKGGGSGLGLNVVYQIVVNKLGGEIECISEVGVFTRFKITFTKSALTKAIVIGGEKESYGK